MRLTKPQLLGLLTVPVAGIAWYATRGAPPDRGAAAAPPVHVAEGESLTTSADRDEVFRRAFWKRPSEDDVILHAERREWADADGVTRWQWFLEVEPSAQLATYLFEQNAFRLSPVAGRVAAPSERPGWYPEDSEGFETHRGGGGEMTLLFDRSRGLLYASGTGRGFARGAATPPPALSRNTDDAGGRRLPNSPPPAIPAP